MNIDRIAREFIAAGDVLSIDANGTVGPFASLHVDNEILNKTVTGYISPQAWNANDKITCMTSANDDNGSLYICGIYTGTLEVNGINGPISLGSSGSGQFQVRTNGYIAKVSKNGTGDTMTWYWAKRLFSGSGSVTITSCCLDSSEKYLYVCGISTGNVASDDIANTKNSANLKNAFVAKVYVKGGSEKVLWVATTQGFGDEGFYAIKPIPAERGGGVYVTGYTTQAPLPQDANKSDGSTNAVMDLDVFTGQSRAIVMRLDSDGRWIWLKSVGDFSVSSFADAMTISPTSGIAYIGGYSTGPDVVLNNESVGVSSIILKNANTSKPFGIVAAISPLGVWQWGAALQGSGQSSITALTFDGTDNRLYIGGTCQGTVSIAVNSSQNSIVYSDASTPKCFLLKMNRTQNGYKPFGFTILDTPYSQLTSLSYNAIEDHVALTTTSNNASKETLNPAPEGTPLVSKYLEYNTEFVLQYSFDTSRPTNPTSNDSSCWSIVTDSFGRTFVAGAFLESLQWISFASLYKSPIIKAQVSQKGGQYHESVITVFERTRGRATRKSGQNDVQKSGLLEKMEKDIRGRSESNRSIMSQVSQHSIKSVTSVNNSIKRSDPIPSSKTGGAIISRNVGNSAESEQEKRNRELNYEILGVALNSANPGETCRVQYDGIVTITNGLGLVTGRHYYAGPHGSLTLEENDRRMGIAVSARELVLRIL